MAHLQEPRNEVRTQDPGQGLQEIDERAQNTTERAGEAAKEGKEKAGKGADKAASAAKEGGKNVSEGAKNAAGKAGDAANSAGENAKETAGQAKEGAQSAAEKAGDVANTAGEDLKGAASQAKDALGDTATKAGEKTREFAGGAQETAKSAGDKAKEGAGRAKGAAEDVGERTKEGARDAADKTSSAADDAKNSAGEGAEKSAVGAEGIAEQMRSAALDEADSNLKKDNEEEEDDYEVIRADPEADKEFDSDGHDEDVGSLEDQIQRIRGADTGPVSTSESSKDTNTDSSAVDSSIESAGEKTKDVLPLQSTTVGEQAKDDTEKTFPAEQSQTVQKDTKASPRNLDMDSIDPPSGDDRKETGFGVAGKDADVKVNDRSSKPDTQPEFPEEYGAADDEFVTRTAYKDEKMEDDSDPGTLVSLKNKIAGISD